VSRAGVSSWMLARLDAFISESLRQSSVEELNRCRMLVGVNLILLLVCVLFLLYAVGQPARLSLVLLTRWASWARWGSCAGLAPRGAPRCCCAPSSPRGY
jgi:hypothetical protein